MVLVSVASCHAGSRELLVSFAGNRRGYEFFHRSQVFSVPDSVSVFASPFWQLSRVARGGGLFFRWMMVVMSVKPRFI